jgi:hypothetical protein
MIVNLYVDHLMKTPPASAEEVWNATREHPKLFADAADRIGLSPREYKEFRTSLLDGKATYVQLPRRLDAMSGARRGSVYAVKNAMMNQSIMGWRVALADGNAVYVPQICGNISLLRHAAVAATPRRRYVAATHHKPQYTPTIATTPVDVTPPAVPEAPAETPPVVAQAVPLAAAAHPGGILFLVPAAIGGAIAGLTGHGGTTPTPSVPPCSAGSNAVFACQK